MICITNFRSSGHPTVQTAENIFKGTVNIFTRFQNVRKTETRSVNRNYDC